MTANEIMKSIKDNLDSVDSNLKKISVNPQEPKTGKWIAVENEEMETIGYYCSECDLPMETENQTRFCPNCGARMVEPQETETWNGYHGQITAPKGTFERIFNDADDDNDI